MYVSDLELRCYGCKVLSVAAGNSAFPDDILLLALAPFHLQIMLNIFQSYCHQWNVATVFTQKRTQPGVHVRYGDRCLSQIGRFVHLGILYSLSMKNKDE